MDDPARSGRAVGLLVAANLLWSTGGWLIKSLPLGGLAVAGWRSAVAGMFLWAARAWWLRGRPEARLPVRWGRPALWLGAASFALNTICFVTATKLTSAAHAILLQYTAPLYVVLAGALWLKEPVRRADLAALGAAAAGLLVLLGDRLGGGAATGDLLALAAGLFFAGTLLALRHEASQDPLLVPLLGCALAALGLAPVWLAAPPPLEAWPRLLGLGIGQFGLAYALYALALRQVRAVTGVLVAAVEPVLNPVWVALLLHERPSPNVWLGGALVLGAVLGRGAWAAWRAEAAN